MVKEAIKNPKIRLVQDTWLSEFTPLEDNDEVFEYDVCAIGSLYFQSHDKDQIRQALMLNSPLVEDWAVHFTGSLQYVSGFTTGFDDYHVTEEDITSIQRTCEIQGTSDYTQGYLDGVNCQKALPQKRNVEIQITEESEEEPQYVRVIAQ